MLWNREEQEDIHGNCLYGAGGVNGFVMSIDRNGGD